MQGFAQLYVNLDASTSTRHKVDALCTYWRTAPAEDAAWAVYFLAGGRPRRTLSTTALRQWAAHAAGVDEWLFDASYAVVGDLAETMAHLLPHGDIRDDTPLHRWMKERLLPWRELPPDEQKVQLSTWVQTLAPTERFVLFKMIGGGWRVGVSRQLVIRSLAEYAGLPAPVVAQRLMGYTDARHQPEAADFEQLVAPETAGIGGLQPYPFFLAHPLEAVPESPVADWLAEWKFDGIRAQIVRRQGCTGVWSRGEELMNDAFPDLLEACRHWPDGIVLDGEIVVRENSPAKSDADATPPLLSWDWSPAPFVRLQTRIRRKQVTRAVLRDHPVMFVPYDVLELHGQDLRGQAQSARRDVLERLAPTLGLVPSPLLPAGDWPEWQALRLRARNAGLEGLMLKHRDARYGTGRTRCEGMWLKWKLDPMTVDAVLVYAQAGHGRRANLYTDYTFALWNRAPHGKAEVQAVQDAITARRPPAPGDLHLVTFAKAYSGLTDDELRAIDKVIRQTTVDRFGPVRSLKPTLVFELGFEGIGPSPRHKSGVAVRFPRILRWRTDKQLQDADTMTALQQLARV